MKKEKEKKELENKHLAIHDEVLTHRSMASLAAVQV